MKSLSFLVLLLTCVSCWSDDLPVIESEQSVPANVVTDVYGRQYPTLDPNVIYCGPGWGAKMCHFLYKHDGTTWTDADSYYSEFPDVKFSNFWDPHFISFFTVDSTASHCEAWKLGETESDGLKWDIRIKIDQEDRFWFDYNYYGTSEEIEYTTTYKYDVVDGVLHFSSTDGRNYTLRPSERNYSEEALDTEEIVRSEGCLF